MTIGLDLKAAAQERLSAGACLPTNAAERKAVPMAEGLLYYFPNALAEVARVSKRGNDQHNPSEPMHWAMEKSTDHADCIMRHLADAGTRDTDGMRHSAKVAWRALALLESECIAGGAKPGRNAIRAPSPDYDPASVAFHAADRPQADKVWDALGKAGAEYFALNYGFVPGDLDNLRCESNSLPESSRNLPNSAVEIAAADGASEYGNPVTPGCATGRLT
jgi:hypothetical protein